ncbi:hypothetical protein OJF2_34170 [Aquisphaera giovannonii]|uniref:Uncharacterized protein n=1 Tax=Aquisphaera giovannonii TaxID=406548 RepID=A0A5B9W2K7_9BACT|nr:hypothetical protein [Aquisphaera giovannonii]QEH34872.1 hypothetical protein OJF2_34170 [Aquisphaera giovannonii]
MSLPLPAERDESMASTPPPLPLPPDDGARAPAWLTGATTGAGLLAGAAAWSVGEAVLAAFPPPLTRTVVMGMEIFRPTFQDQSAADYRNGTMAFAALGGLLGLAMGIAGGLARRSVRAGLRAGAIGLVLGAALGAAASLALIAAYLRAADRSPEELSRDLFLPLAVHGGIWAACGLAGGAALGMGLGGPRGRVLQAAVGGLIGAAAGAVLYELIGASAFPADRTASPVSATRATRLMARLLVAGLAGLVAALVVNLPTAREDAAADRG